jgi:hypothetical protein
MDSKMNSKLTALCMIVLVVLMGIPITGGLTATDDIDTCQLDPQLLQHANMNHSTDICTSDPSDIIMDIDARTSDVFFARDGSFIEHTPSLIQASNGTFFLAYESGDPGWHFTINLTWSPDGAAWFDQGAIVSTGGSYGNRHPTLIQRQDGDLQVVYLTDRTGTFQLYTSISSDGMSWVEYSPLGVSGPAINPFMILEEGGSFAMSYQRYGSGQDGSYFATSADGITWSTTGSRVSTRALPRLMRASGGGDYLMTFQGGSSGDFEIRYKTSGDGLTWSPERTLTNTGNSHDSFPFELENGTFLVYFCTSLGGAGYDLYRKWSPDMFSWSSDELIDVGNVRFDTEPHAFQLQSNQTTLLSWGYESSGPVGGYEDVDIALIWMEDLINYDITLSQGWNLVSFPVEVEDESLAEVLSTIDGQWENLQIYDPTGWHSTVPSRPSTLNDVFLLNKTVGFWIDCDVSQALLSVQGYAPGITAIPLKAGWNLVGYPSFVERTIADALAGTGYDSPVEGFDGGAPYRTTQLPNSYNMKSGEAYWIHIPADTTWILDW